MTDSQRLQSFVERIERLEEEKDGLQKDIREVYKEAENEGFDKTVLRDVIKTRKKDPNEREEHEALLETYLNALGMK